MKNLGIYNLLDFWTKIIRNNLRNFIEDPTLLSLIDEIDKIIEVIESKRKLIQKENPENDTKTKINSEILNLFQNFPIIKEISKKKTRYSENDVNIERNINLSYRRSLKNYRMNTHTHASNKNEEDENYKTLSTTRFSFK